ncbi:hypothetical protein MRX96_015637 [Rhipicephalus microplus]
MQCSRQQGNAGVSAGGHCYPAYKSQKCSARTSFKFSSTLFFPPGFTKITSKDHALVDESPSNAGSAATGHLIINIARDAMDHATLSCCANQTAEFSDRSFFDLRSRTEETYQAKELRRHFLNWRAFLTALFFLEPTSKESCVAPESTHPPLLVTSNAAPDSATKQASSKTPKYGIKAIKQAPKDTAELDTEIKKVSGKLEDISIRIKKWKSARPSKQPQAESVANLFAKTSDTKEPDLFVLPTTLLSRALSIHVPEMGSSIRQLYIILWKDVYINQIRRHVVWTLLELAFTVIAMYGIGKDSLQQRFGDPVPEEAFARVQPLHLWEYTATKILYTPDVELLAKELLSIAGTSDLIYWGSHFLSASFTTLLLSCICMLFLFVLGTEPALSYSDPLLVFVVLITFNSLSILHAMFVSVLLTSSRLSIIFSMIYWICSIAFPYLMLQNPLGRGYYLRSRASKIITSTSPGMGLHWAFMVIERFERFRLVHPSSGQIIVDNYDVVLHTDEARERIAYCPADNVLFNELTVEEHLLFFGMVTLWFNGQCPHAAPLIVNMYHSALLRNITGRPTARFFLYNQPYNNDTLVDHHSNNDNGDSEEDDLQVLVQSKLFFAGLPLSADALLIEVLMGIFTPLALCFHVASFVVYPITERCSKFKHLQMMTGVSGTVYWLSNFIFDTLLATSCAVIFVPTIVYSHRYAQKAEYIVLTSRNVNDTMDEVHKVTAEPYELSGAVMIEVFVMLAEAVMLLAFVVIMDSTANRRAGSPQEYQEGPRLARCPLDSDVGHEAARVQKLGSGPMPPEYALVVSKLTKSFGLCSSVDNVSFILKTGQVIQLFCVLRGFRSDDTTAMVKNMLCIMELTTVANDVTSNYTMQQCEGLCDRIAIMLSGQLECIGTVDELKSKFGRGYTITIRLRQDTFDDSEYQEDLTQDMKAEFHSCQLDHSFQGVLEYRIATTYTTWSEMFSKMAVIQKKYRFKEFYVCDTTLEQIFVSYARKQINFTKALALASTP